MRERRKIRRVYGQQEENYDHFFWKSRAKKNKEKQEKTQRNANISLTQNQSAKAAAEARAATFKAKAEQYKAMAAEKAAATADTILQGAKNAVNLQNANLIGKGFLIVGILLVAGYLLRENRKAAQLKANRLKMTDSPVPNYKQ